MCYSRPKLYAYLPNFVSIGLFCRPLAAINPKFCCFWTSAFSGVANWQQSEKVEHWCTTTLCLKKVPTILPSVTLSNLSRFSKFVQCWKAYEICYKNVQQYPSHLRHVATLPWEIKKSNFLQMWKKTQTNCIIKSPLTLSFVHKF